MENSLKTIGEFKARKVGNALVLTIPSELNIHEGERFKVSATSNGSELIYERKGSDNPWFNGTFDHVDFDALLHDIGDLGNIKPVDEEKTEW